MIVQTSIILRFEVNVWRLVSILAKLLVKHEKVWLQKIINFIRSFLLTTHSLIVIIFLPVRVFSKLIEKLTFNGWNLDHLAFFDKAFSINKFNTFEFLHDRNRLYNLFIIIIILSFFYIDEHLVFISKLNLLQ